MVTFSLIVLMLSFAWVWRDVLGTGADRNASLAQVVAASLEQHLEPDASRLCAVLDGLSSLMTGEMYVVDPDGQILCASAAAALSAGAFIEGVPGLSSESDQAFPPSAIQDRHRIVAYAPIAGTSWGVILEEPRSSLVAPAYSFLVAISALMIVGLFISFLLLLIGFRRISWPLSAVTEQARRVTAGKEFVPPDVGGPAEVEALVAAFNRMVTQLRSQRDTLHDYATRTLHSQEEERKRISRDLHDETAQELVGLIQRIDLCRLEAEDDPKMQANLDELTELTSRALTGVRRMSQALRPLILEDLGLVAALQVIADELDQQLPGARVFCEVIGQEERLRPEVELTAFRIVQETLTNVRKHAGEADRAYVTVQFKPGMLSISVEDNGRGFYLPERAPQANSEHLGLIGMKERSELLGGSLTILTGPGEGTQVLLELPLGKPEVARMSD